MSAAVQLNFFFKEKNYNVAVHIFGFKNNKNPYLYAHFQNVMQPATL